MKRSNMKSDFAVRSRCQSEGRIFPRRKVTSKSLLNGGIGDFEMELSLAIQESLKYVERSVGDSQELSLKSVCDANSANRTDLSEKNIRKDNNIETRRQQTESEEVGRLKDLLLAQAELIQCQQDENNQKEKELNFLRSENSNLQCRLMRMERRLSVFRHKEVPQDTAEISLNGMGHKVESSSIVNNRKSKHDFKRGYKGQKFSTRKKSKWRTQAGYLSHTQPVTDNECEESEKEVGESSAMEESCSGSDNESVCAGNDSKDLSGDEGESEEAKRRVYIDYPIMHTDTLYHFYYPKHLNPTLDMNQLQERAAQQAEVETPSWRMNPLTNMYQLEGTENITDEAYFKRHQKHELEEKRRKRWDLQRLRELRIFEKFQEEKESALRENQDEADVETFLPSVHDLTHIEITSSIPVMAFGQPVPYISPGEFEIPWDMTNNPASSRSKSNGIKSSTKR